MCSWLSLHTKAITQQKRIGHLLISPSCNNPSYLHTFLRQSLTFFRTFFHFCMSNRSLYQVQRLCSMVQKFFISVPCNGGLRPSRFFVQAGGGGRRRGAPYTQRTHKSTNRTYSPSIPRFQKMLRRLNCFALCDKARNTNF